MFTPEILPATGADIGDTVNYSVRFNSADTPLLSKAFVTPTSVNIYTLSVWLKRSALSTTQRFFGASTNHSIGFNTSDQLVLTINGTSYTSTDAFRDVAKPYNFVYTQSGTTYTIYVGDPNQSVGYRTVMTGTSVANTAFNTNAVTHQIGAANSASYLDGYLSDVCFVDGVAQLPTAFGRKSADTGAWVHKNPSGLTWGTNGFRLQFNTGASASDLGTDTSGNGNTFTVTNLSVTAGVGNDWLADTPTNTYCTLSPINHVSTYTGPISNGGLTVSGSTPSNYLHAVGSFWFDVTNSSGYYFEFDSLANYYTGAGITKETNINSSIRALSNGGSAGYTWATVLLGPNIIYYSDGAGSYTSTAATVASGTVIGFFVRGGKVWVRDSVGWILSGNPNANTSPLYTGLTGTYAPVINLEASGVGTTNINFGQRSFTYTPPTGYLALCTANLSAIGTVTVSGTFTGNALADGPFVWCNGYPTTLTINGNAVTFGTHADRVAGGFKLRTASASYNASGANTWTATIVTNVKNLFKYATGQANP